MGTIITYEKLITIDGITCVKPKGAMYLFPKIDLSKFTFKDDNDFVLSLLEDQRILVVGGQGFNFKQCKQVLKPVFNAIFVRSILFGIIIALLILVF